MSVKDGKDYLYLIWKSEQTRKQYIIGQLTKNGQYEFQYSEEVQSAIADGFKPLLCFPDLNKVYKEEYDDYMLLKRSGARLPIDNLEFIDPILSLDNNVTRIFFMAGVRHYLDCDGEECNRSIKVTRGDEVFLREEPENFHDQNAVQFLNTSGKVLGYIPRYYSKEVCKLLKQGKKIVCHIYNVDKNKNCNECIKIIMKIAN